MHGQDYGETYAPLAAMLTLDAACFLVDICAFATDNSSVRCVAWESKLQAYETLSTTEAEMQASVSVGRVAICMGYVYCRVRTTD